MYVIYMCAYGKQQFFYNVIDYAIKLNYIILPLFV